MNIFHEFLYRPMYNLLIWLTDVLPGHDIGLAIIGLTIIIRVLLFPLSKRALDSQKSLQLIQPELEAIRKAHKDNPQLQASEMMNVYKKAKVHPLSSCLPILIQLPIFIALYQVLKVGLEGSGYKDLYAFVAKPESLNVLFLGFLTLALPSRVLALLAGAAQFVQARQMSTLRPPKEVAGKPESKDEDMAAIMNRQMTVMMPLMTVVISWQLPAGLTLYWLVSTLLQIVQQYFSFKSVPKTVEHHDELTPPPTPTPTALP